MRRSRRILRRFAVAVLAIVLLSYAGYRFWLPGFVARQIEAAMIDAGLTPVAVSDMSVGFFRMDAAVVAGADRELTIRGVGVTYTPLMLLRGRVEAVELAGVEWRTRVDAQGVRLVPFDRIEGSDGDVGALPFDRFVLRDAVVRLTAEGQEIVIPIEATMRGATFNVAIGGEGGLRVQGVWDPQTGAIDAEVEPLTVALAGDAAAVVRAWSGWTVGGVAEVGGAVRFGTGEESGLRVAVRELAASGPASTVTLEGLDAAVTVASVWPPRTGPGQELTWQKLAVGGLTLEEGHALFEVTDPERIDIRSVGWRIADGRFRMDAFGLDVAQPRIETTLHLENVDLERWLSLVSYDRLHGEGRVSGQAAFAVNLSPLRLAFGAGELAATGPGVIRVEDRGMIQQALAASGSIDLGVAGARLNLQDRIVEALREFQYHDLRFTLIPATNEVLMRISMSGRGVRGARQAFDPLTINVEDVNTILNTAAEAKWRWDRFRGSGSIVPPRKGEQRP